MIYLLDSSAWLAHLFGEPGVDEINNLLDDAQNEVNLSVLSLPEVYGRLKALGQPEQWPAVWAMYQPLFDHIIPITEGIAQQAIVLRATTPERLPTIDGLIAATAVIHTMVLVHRDPHLATIPTHLLQQVHLHEK
jgi:hypothetical protein